MTYQEAAVISRATGHTSIPVRKKEHRELRDILVYVDNRKPRPARVQAVIDLALAHRAHLIGLYGITDPHFPSSIKVQISADVLAAQAVNDALPILRRAEKVNVITVYRHDVSADDGADLIVIGAYGHARWRELVLGGLTLHMLKHITVPVLMSH